MDVRSAVDLPRSRARSGTAIGLLGGDEAPLPGVLARAVLPGSVPVHRRPVPPVLPDLLDVPAEGDEEGLEAAGEELDVRPLVVRFVPTHQLGGDGLPPPVP